MPGHYYSILLLSCCCCAGCVVAGMASARFDGSSLLLPVGFALLPPSLLPGRLMMIATCLEKWRACSLVRLCY
jgi:hypothetical protein